jgi:hypothetical protein
MANNLDMLSRYKHDDKDLGIVTGIFEDGSIEVVLKGGFTLDGDLYVEDDSQFALVNPKSDSILEIYSTPRGILRTVRGK